MCVCFAQTVKIHIQNQNCILWMYYVGVDFLHWINTNILLYLWIWDTSITDAYNQLHWLRVLVHIIFVLFSLMILFIFIWCYGSGSGVYWWWNFVLLSDHFKVIFVLRQNDTFLCFFRWKAFYFGLIVESLKDKINWYTLWENKTLCDFKMLILIF